MLIPRLKRVTLKRLKQLERNHGSVKYQIWRDLVLIRDENRCQYPGCEKKELLQIHHIKKWSRSRHLRYNLYNGVALCKTCHQQKVNGKEGRFELLFIKIALFRTKQHIETCKVADCILCQRLKK